MPQIGVSTTAAASGQARIPFDHRSIGYDEPVTLGREGEIEIGVDPEDTGISRQALTVAATAAGWKLTCTNANGAVLYPWGQASRWAEPGREEIVRWPLLGIRLVGTRPDLHHWVLAEFPGYADGGLEPARDSTHTSIGRPPSPLTDPQLAAVRTVFAAHLAWPPIAGASPVPIQAAASRLGVSHAAVYQRLEAARQRAYQVGSHQQIGVSEPEYVYVLARAGLLAPPPGTAGPADG